MRNTPLKAFTKSSPTKHKMEAHPRYHGAGGIGWVDEVTAEQVKAHDDKYGEGHSSHSSISAMGRAAAKKLKEKKKVG